MVLNGRGTTLGDKRGGRFKQTCRHQGNETTAQLTDLLRVCKRQQPLSYNENNKVRKGRGVDGRQQVNQSTNGPGFNGTNDLEDSLKNRPTTLNHVRSYPPQIDDWSRRRDSSQRATNAQTFKFPAACWRDVFPGTCGETLWKIWRRKINEIQERKRRK